MIECKTVVRGMWCYKSLMHCLYAATASFFTPNSIISKNQFTPSQNASQPFQKRGQMYGESSFHINLLTGITNSFRIIHATQTTEPITYNRSVRSEPIMEIIVPPIIQPTKNAIIENIKFNIIYIPKVRTLFGLSNKSNENIYVWAKKIVEWVNVVFLPFCCSPWMCPPLCRNEFHFPFVHRPLQSLTHARAYAH